MTRKRNVTSNAHVRLLERSSNVSLEQVEEEYQLEMVRKGLSKYSVIHEKDNVKSILKLLPEGITLDLVNAKLFDAQVFDVMRTKGLSPNTINDRLKTLRRFLDFAVRAGYLGTNPAHQVQKMITVVPEIPSLSNAQMVALLRQPDSTTFTGLRDRVLILLMLDNGIRLREAMDLTISQIDLKERRLRAVEGKNRKKEDIPLSHSMCKALQSYLRERDHAVVDQVFVSINGESLNRRTFQLRLKEYGRQAGITDVRVSPHTLRHTFAKQWILNGGDVFSLQRILRHSTMDMVKRYVFLWSNEVQQQHDKFSPMTRLFNRRGDFIAQ